MLVKRVKQARRLQKESAQAHADDEVADERVRLLRLALRRLRNALTFAGAVLRLPHSCAPETLSPLLRRLGVPRDAEATMATLLSAEEAAGPAVSAEEHSRVAAVQGELAQRKRRGFKSAVEHLRASRRVSRLLEETIAAAGKEGAFRRLAHAPEVQGVIRLLLRTSAALFSFSGWEVTIAPLPGPAPSAEPWEWALGVEGASCARLHALRRKLRECRYTLDAVAKLFEKASGGGAAWAAFQEQRDAVRVLQDGLGVMHDSEVAVQLLGAHPARDYPATLAELRRRHEEAWGRVRAGAAQLCCARGQLRFYAALCALGGGGASESDADLDTS